MCISCQASEDVVHAVCVSATLVSAVKVLCCIQCSLVAAVLIFIIIIIIVIVLTRETGCQEKTWWDCVRGDLECFGFSHDGAQDDDQWRLRIKPV